MKLILTKDDDILFSSFIDTTNEKDIKLFDKEWDLLGLKIFNQIKDHSCFEITINLK